MTYKETLDFLYAQLPMFQRVGSVAYKKGLDNILALCEALGNPQNKFKSIHIAGTNGKGSVSHILASICQEAGLKTGLYTSPHYRDFRERIKLDGQLVSEDYVVQFVEDTMHLIDQIKPSYFELTVAMAFDYFAKQKADVAIVEVGLGGRLDSTNILSPLLSIITNIGFDHMAVLGNTLELIAGEKAGIIKSNTPVLISETHPQTAPVFTQKARELNAPILFTDQISEIQVIDSSRTDNWDYEITIPQKGVFKIQSDAIGPYQHKNILCAWQACEWLKNIPEFSSMVKTDFDEARMNGLKSVRTSTRFIGRWHILGEEPTVLADSAHNESGLKLLFQGIENISFEQLHVVCGFANDKELDGILPLFPKNAKYYFAKADVPRGLDAATLQETAGSYDLRGEACTSVPDALEIAKKHAGKQDLILVCGSIFVLAELV
jgi:dihydrofolate synthase/folylpolyglutamate synthase